MPRAASPLPPVLEPVSAGAVLLDGLLVRTRGLLRLLLYAVLAAAPLALEGLFPGARLGVEALLLGLVLCWLAQRLACPVSVSLNLEWLKLPALLWVGLAVLQLLPLPASFVQGLSTLRAEKAILFPALLGSFPLPSLEPLSLAPERTVQSLFKLVLLLGLLAAARDQLRDRAARRDVLHFLLQLGAFQVVLGLLQLQGQASGIYFVESWRVGDFSFFGSFLNANRNAAFLNLLWPIALGLGLAGWERTRGSSGKRESASRQGVWPVSAYFGMAAFLLLGALLCRSRGGWAVSGLMLLAFPVWHRARRSGVAKAGLLFLQLVVPLGVILAALWEPLLTLLAELAQKNLAFGRAELWSATVRMMRDQTVAGVGLGAFSDAFGPYNRLEQFAAPRHAENVWVEQLVEQGLIGVVGVLLALLNLVALLLRKRVWEEPPGQRGLSGLVIGLFGVAIHGMTEQVLRGYGVSVTAVVILAVLVATLEERGQNPFDPFFRFGVPPKRVWLPLGMFPVGLGLAGSLALGPLLYEDAQKVLSGRDAQALTTLESRVGAASRLAPLSAELLQLQGTFLLLRFEAESQALEKQVRIQKAKHSNELASAESYFIRSILLSPLNGTTHRLYAALLAVQGEHARALTLITEAARIAPSDHRNALELGRMRLRANAREEGLQALKQALRLLPVQGLPLLERVVTPVLRALPEASVALWSEDVPWWVAEAMGQTLFKANQYLEAVLWFETLLDVRGDRLIRLGAGHGIGTCPDDPQERPDDFQPARRVALLALAQGDLALAEEAAEHLSRCFPKDNLDRIIRARVRAREGKVEEAVTLVKAAAADSGNPVPILLEAVRFYQEAQAQDEAERLLQDLVAAHPSSTTGLLALAAFQERTRKDLTGAVETLHAAIRIDPTLEESRLQLYRLYMALGLEVQALGQLQTCQSLGRAPRCLLAAGQHALLAGKPEEAVRLLTQALQQMPDSSEAAEQLKRAKQAAGGEPSRPASGQEQP